MAALQLTQLPKRRDETERAILPGTFRLARAALRAMPQDVRLEKLDQRVLVLLQDRFHYYAGIVIEELGRRADRGATAAAHAGIERVTGNNVVLDPPDARLFLSIPVPPDDLVVAEAFAPLTYLAPVLFPLERRGEQNLHVRIIAGAVPEHLFLSQPVIEVDDFAVGGVVEKRPCV